MCRLRLFLLLIALKVSCHAQNVEVFCPPNDAVLSYDYQNDFITVRTAHNKFIRTGINSYEEYSEKYEYLDLKHNEEWIDRIEVKNGCLEIHHQPVLSLMHIDTSIRSVNFPYIGTYKGILYNNKVLKGGDYCNSEIRLYNDTAYVCFDGLLVYYSDSLIQTYDGDIIATFIYHGHDLGLIQDIIVTKQFWITLTSHGIFKLDRQTHEVDTLLLTDFQSAQNSRFTNNLFGWHKNYWFQIDTLTYELNVLDTLPSTIKYVDETKTLFTTDQEVILNDYYYGTDTLLRGAFHSAVRYNQNYILLSSNSGLIVYDRVKSVLDTIIKAEFNSNSFYIMGDTLFAGSVMGLWKINMNNINQLPSYSLRQKENWFKANMGRILSAIFLLLGFVFFLVGKTKKTRNEIYTPTNSNLSTISEYIDNNIRTVTINSLMTTFNLSQNGLYEICQPLTPGELIRNKRIELIKENLSSKSVKELSEISGFSKAYLQRKVLPELRK